MSQLSHAVSLSTENPKYDLTEALYWWYANHHEGQTSESYRRLCILAKFFYPSLSKGPEPNSFAQFLYQAKCDDEGCTHEE